jgi:hypothetical protein
VIADEWIEELGEAIQSAGARITFDQGASIRRPCTFCGKASALPLWAIGIYPNGDVIRRPVCSGCVLYARARGARP